MCTIAQIVNVLHSLLMSDGPQGRKCVRTTTYHAFMLFKPHRSKTAVRVEGTGSDPLGLSVSASKSASEIVVSFVNPRNSADVSVACSFARAPPKQSAAQLLHHSDMNAYNSFDDADKIVPKPHPVAVEGGRIRLDVPSMAMVTGTLQS